MRSIMLDTRQVQFLQAAGALLCNQLQRLHIFDQVVGL
jgi:hypothetical protein